MTTGYTLQQTASQVRRDIIRMVTAAASGHPGGSLSSTDFLTYLFFKQMNVTPETWKRSGEGLDMFFLSAGHLTPVLYSVLARRGYFPASELSSFRRFGSRLQGHPSVEWGVEGINQSAGSLGQGLSVALGAALAKKLSGDDRSVYVLVGDGESEEGQIWEAAMVASHHKADNLVAMTDWNHQQIDGSIENVGGMTDLKSRWEAFGWKVIEADGHDFTDIEKAFNEASAAKGAGKPIMILFRTEMGHGVDFMAGTHKWHGKNPSQEQCDAAMKQLEETIGDF
ncbi:MAG: transketolase [Bacteroidales bacterium]|nr:transketolase [Candidatus Cacconaster equifaecalis]MCQ2151968.1 transketolase [Bacteroidales bacterium]